MCRNRTPISELVYGSSQKIVARRFEGRKKSRDSLGRKEALVERICFSQVRLPRNARSRSQECWKKRPGTHERRP
jgi:hypothetical protein